MTMQKTICKIQPKREISLDFRDNLHLEKTFFRRRIILQMGCGVILAVADSREQLKEEAAGHTAKKVQRKMVVSNKTAGVDIDRQAQSHRSPVELKENRTAVKGVDDDRVIEHVESKPEEKLCGGVAIEIGGSDGKVKEDKQKSEIKEKDPVPVNSRQKGNKVVPSVKAKVEIEKEVKVQTRVGIVKQNEVSKIDGKNKGLQIKKQDHELASELKKDEQKQKKTGSIKPDLQRGRNSDDSKNASVKKDVVRAVKVQNAKRVEPKQDSKIVESKTNNKQVKKEQPQLQRVQKGKEIKVQKRQQKQTKKEQPKQSSPRQKLLQSNLKNDKPQFKQSVPKKIQQKKQGRSESPLRPKKEEAKREQKQQSVIAQKKEEVKPKQGLKKEEQKTKTIELPKESKAVDGKQKLKEEEKKSKIVNESPPGQVEEPSKITESFTAQLKKTSQNPQPAHESSTLEPQNDEGIMEIENVPQVKATEIKQTCRINTAEKSSHQSKRSQKKYELNDIHTNHPSQIIQKISQSSISDSRLKSEKEPNRQMIPVDSLFLNEELMNGKTEERESKTQIQNQSKTQISARPGSRQQFKNGGTKSKQLMEIKQNREEPLMDLSGPKQPDEHVISHDTSMSNIVPEGSRHSKKMSTNKSLVSKRQVRAIQLQKQMKRLKQGMKKAKEEQTKKILIESNHLKKVYNL